MLCYKTIWKISSFLHQKNPRTQKKYTVTDKEPLSIVEALKYFRTILLGQGLKIYTDHSNIT